MADVVCIWHEGIRCCIPSHEVLAAAGKSQETALVRLWEGLGDSGRAGGDRVLDVQTASGPRAIEGRDVVIVSLPLDCMQPLSPLLRELIPLPHVVGVAELGKELVWLVDTKRFFP